MLEDGEEDVKDLKLRIVLHKKVREREKREVIKITLTFCNFYV